MTSANASTRVTELMASMTLKEKLAQLQGIWVGAGADGGVVAPTMDAQSQLASDFTQFAADGLGQLTRVYGTKPVSPREGLENLIKYQKFLAEHTRLRIAALAHEECLTGVAAWKATTFPTPIAWAASFDPGLVRAMGEAIGESMSALGVHQGLAPVLDVVRDHRWGRVEETLGEDPYEVAELAKGYVEGVQSRGVVATLKHFVGYSNSRAARNLAPAHAGWREIEDVFLLPFEVGVLDAHVRSVMNAYVEIDGIPVAANPHVLTEILRDRWGFAGTVVADYFAVAFLADLHGVADGHGEAAYKALRAGIDVELPTGKTFREPFEQYLSTHPDAMEYVDRALERVLCQKEELGLLDIDAEIARLEKLLETVPETLDPAEHRAIARKLAEQSIVLLDNKNNLLPIAPKPGLKIAVVGPNADRQAALFGCYSFVNHVLKNNPGVPSCIEAPTILEGIRSEFEPAGATVTYAEGCTVREGNRAAMGEAVAVAQAADVVIAVMGDESGLFGKGTSGEGCDTDSLQLPGVQESLVTALIDTGKPVILIPVTGRPYAIGKLADQAAATIQAFFPGEAGASAVAGVLSGRVNPSGRMPVTVPASVGVEPYSYLHPKLGEPSDVSTVKVAPAFTFGHGQSYTSFEYADVAVASTEAPTDGWIDVSVTVSNTGQREGAEVVQLYGHDVVGSTTRPVVHLVGFTRIVLAAGERRRVTFHVPTSRFAFHNPDMRRVVEPGMLELWFGRSCTDKASDTLAITLTGDDHEVTPASPRLVEVR